MADAMTAEIRAAEKIFRETLAEGTPFYKAALTLARIDKSKVEDADDKLCVMRALRVLHSAQEVNKNKSLPKARV